MKSTPGPWIAAGRTVYDTNWEKRIALAYASFDTERFGEDFGNDLSDEEAFSNATLISAAPDLYDSLEEMVNILEGFSKVILREKYSPSQAEIRAREVLKKCRMGGEK